MQGKKAIFLFLALLLPIGIFIFLKMFGKNEFDIPPFYHDQAPVAANCNIEYKAPYALADTTMSELRKGRPAELYLLNFSGELSARIKDELNYSELKIVNSEEFEPLKNDRFRRCVLIIPAEEDLVIVDKQGRIRGYYTSSNREEVDRLFLEVRILLKKY